MKKIILMIIVVFIPFSSNSMEVFNKKMSAGIFSGYNINQHRADFNSMKVNEEIFSANPEGIGQGIKFGGLFEFYSFNNLSFALRFGYSNISSELNLSVGEYPKNIRVYDEDGNLIDNKIISTSIDWIFDSNITLFTIEPEINYFLNSKWNISAGLSLSYFLENSFSSKLLLISSNDAVFLNTGTDTSILFENEQIPDISSLLMRFSIGTSYHININDNFEMVPEIKYYFALSDIISTDSWKINSLYLGASLRYILY